MYAPPHAVKKCVVLCVMRLLYFVNPSLYLTSPNTPFRNIVQCLSVTKFFTMFLEKFLIEVWSFMRKLKLFPFLWHSLPAPTIKSLSFIFSRKDCHDFRNYHSCYKMYDTFLTKTTSKAVCEENQILFVDVRPLLLRHNPNIICCLPYPFVGEFRYPNEYRIFPNVTIDIIQLFVV